MRGGLRTLILIVLTVVAISAARQLIGRPSSVQQPIEFNHKKHVGMGLPCSNCHPYSQSQSFAGMPGIAECAPCHQVPLGKSSEAKKMTSYVEKMREIPWERVYSVPSHVYFSHRRHTLVAALECSTCHGHVERATSPITRPAIAMTMDWCMNCHKQKHASLDCNSCHR